MVVSVRGGGLCQAGVSVKWGNSVQGVSVRGESLSGGVSVHGGGLCPGGSLSGGSLSERPPGHRPSVDR